MTPAAPVLHALLQLLELLVSLGGRLDERDGRRESLLHTAATAGACNVLRFLIRQGKSRGEGCEAGLHMGRLRPELGGPRPGAG